VTTDGASGDCATPNAGRRARIWCGSHALSCFFPQRALTRINTAHTSCTTLASSHLWGSTVGRRRASSNARSARCAVRTDCRGRAGTLRWCKLASASSARPRHASGKVCCECSSKGCQRRGPSSDVGASRLAPLRALHASQAWGGTVCLKGCILGTQQRIRSARGHRRSPVLRSPGAPAVVIVTGGWRPSARTYAPEQLRHGSTL